MRHSAVTFAPWWSRAVRKHAPEYPAGSTRGRRPRRGTGKTGTRGRTSAVSSRSSAASCAHNSLHHYTCAPTHQQTRRVHYRTASLLTSSRRAPPTCAPACETSHEPRRLWLAIEAIRLRAISNFPSPFVRNRVTSTEVSVDFIEFAKKHITFVHRRDGERDSYSCERAGCARSERKYLLSIWLRRCRCLRCSNRTLWASLRAPPRHGGEQLAVN